MRIIVNTSKYKKPYETIAFSIEYTNNSLYYYVIDKDNEIERICGSDEFPLLESDQQVFIRNLVDRYDNSWIRKDNFEGYDYFIDNIHNLELIKDYCIAKKKELLDYYHNYRNSNYINCDTDIIDFLLYVRHFDESQIENIEYNLSKDRITLRITSDYFYMIKLDFIGGIDTNISIETIKYLLINALTETNIKILPNKRICFEFSNNYIYADKIRFRCEINKFESATVYICSKAKIWMKRNKNKMEKVNKPEVAAVIIPCSEKERFF